MPRGDRTGPMGHGPMTGRGAGYCAGFDTPGFMNTGSRAGMGLRRGAGGRGGHGYRHRNVYYATGLPGWMRYGYSPGWGGMPPGGQYLQQTGQLPQATEWFEEQSGTQPDQPQTPIQPSKEQEIQILENQLDVLTDQVDQIKQRIEELRSE